MPESTSPRRFPTQPFWRSLRVAVIVVLVGIVLVVGFTRTQAGRDAIRDQVEAAFNQQYAGQLSIGTLQGTLIDDVVATDLRLETPSGGLVATVDSVRAVPRWANLLTAELAVRTLTLHGPHLRLQRDTAGTWNAQRALQPTASSADASRPFDLTFADIQVRRGALTTTRAGPPPDIVREGWLFDYTRTRIRDISLRATAQRIGDTSLLALNAASFALPGLDLEPSLLQGRLRRTATGWSVADLDLSLGTTRLQGRASLDTDAPDEAPNAVSLILDRSRVDHAELKQLVPQLPFADVVTVQGRIGGTLKRLRADGITVTHDSSAATLAGTIARTPGAFAVDLQLRESTVSLRDVRDVWPGLPSRFPGDLGPLRVEGTLRGTAARPRPAHRGLDLEATLAMRSPHGAVQGSLDVAREDTAPLRYRATLTTDSLNLAPFTGRPALASVLTGRVDAQGSGVQRPILQARIRASLDSSVVAGRPLASADGQVAFDDSSAQGRFSVQQAAGGSVFVEGSVDQLNASRPRYTAAATGSNLDLSSIVPGLPSTALNGRVTLRGAGTRWRPLAGTVVADIDSSTLVRGDSTVALSPHTATLRLAERGAEAPRLTVTGSLGTLTVDAPREGPSLWTTARTWAQALGDAYRRERNKPSPASPLPSAATEPAPPSAPQPPPRLARTSSEKPVRAEASLRVRRPDILHAWWGAFPRRAERLSAQARLSLTPDSIRASGRISAERLRGPAYDAARVQARYEVTSRLGAPLARATRATATVSARRLAAGGPPLNGLSAGLAYENRRGTLRLSADSAGVADSLRIDGALRITPRTNELRLQTVALTLNGAAWTNPAPAALRIYADRVVLSPFRLEQPHPQAPSLQRLQVAGILSGSPTDTLSVTAQNVYLPPLSRAVSTPNLIGGNLSGRATLRGGLGQPLVSTDVAVRRLSYDRRILGDARLRASYAPSSPVLSLDGTLRGAPASADRLTGPAFVPGPVRSVDPNRLSVSGTVRVPGWLRSAPARTAAPPKDDALDSDALDLTVDLERADLFFFRYIFEERVSRVRGFTTGELHIGGAFHDPVFDADLEIVNGGVTLPLFGLQYQVEGPVAVDRRGIHARGLSVQDADGSATVQGSILFNDYQYFSFDLSARLNGLTVIDVSQAEDLPFYGTIRASGPLRLTGPLSDATLRSDAARTTPDSELFIPVTSETVEEDAGFIVFADSTGRAPDVSTFTRRQNILADRPEGVPSFVEGLNLDFNVTAPEASTVNLVFDPVVGDVVTVVGSGRVQLQRTEGDFSVYGSFRATSGTYLFTAGEVFVRRFSIAEGTITWDGDPTNAQLDLDAEYRTRASPSGLPGFQNARGRIPVTVLLDITGRVATPRVDLGLSLTRSEQRNLVGSESLDAVLNQPARTTEYATSVLLTNTFLLTTESFTQPGGGEGGSENRLTTAGNQLAFNSVSQLVSSQLNRYLGRALPNVDLNFGVQGEDPDNLDLIYGVALRLLNERLIIRGEGVYTSDDTEAQQVEGPQGEFVVEVRLSSSVSAKIFYRRDGDELTRNQSLTSSRGAGVSYQTRFSTWRALFERLFGWLLPDDDPEAPEDAPPPVAEQTPAPADSTSSPPPRP